MNPTPRFRAVGSSLFAGLLVLAGLVAAPAPANAQSVALLVGLTRSNLVTGTPADAPTVAVPEVSRSGGAFFALSIGTDVTRRASIAVEAAYLVRGLKFTAANGFTVQRLTYLEMPVLGRLNLGQFGPVGAHVLGGPTVGVRVTARDQLTTVSVADRVSRFDTGLMAGGGVDVRGFTVQVRYEWGLKNIARNGGLLGTGTMKNRTLIMLVLLPLATN